MLDDRGLGLLRAPSDIECADLLTSKVELDPTRFISGVPGLLVAFAFETLASCLSLRGDKGPLLELDFFKLKDVELTKLCWEPARDRLGE